MQRRIVSLWFPRLPSDRVLRADPHDGPFALTIRQSNTERLYCLNPQAETEGLSRDMALSDARALCPNLRTTWADPKADQHFLRGLARWAGRYCPWIGLDGPDGLVLDITGSAHLMGGEAALLSDLRTRFRRAHMHVQAGLADTRGAAWALAHFREGRAPVGAAWDQLAPLPVTALRLGPQLCTTLERLGIRTIAELAALPRAAATRRFGAEPLLRLDQALGRQPEQVTPLAEPEPFSATLTLPEPVGLTSDVAAALARLLGEVCAKLEKRQKGARVLELTLRRVDQASTQIELRLARAMRDAERMQELFAKHLDGIDAGFGIDRLRLEATDVEDLRATQLSQHTARRDDRLADLITRMGNRIGLDNIHRFLPAESHIPERGYLTAPAAYSAPAEAWWPGAPRPIHLFPPEPIAAHGAEPPTRFRWRSVGFTTARATGPERIAPEWWLDDPAWREGLRDYWRIETRQGRRLWLFHTPQNPAWFVHGEFA